MSTTTPPDRRDPLVPSVHEGRTRAPNIAWSGVTLAVSLVALVALIVYSQSTKAGQRHDQAAMDTIDADGDTVRELLSWLGYISIGTTAVALVVCIALAVVRHRYAAAVAAAGMVAGANITTQFLKRTVIDRSDFGYLSVPSIPSGHTTVVISLVLAALLISPHGTRFAITFLGSIVATLAGASTVVAGWHRPADVLAALLVSLAWGALAVLVLSVRRAGMPPAGGSAHTFLSLIGAAAAGALLVFVGVRPDNGWTGFGDAALMLGCLGVATAVTVGWFARMSASHSV
ncbi:phosphatase PAP2 family protein [Solicola gregarius]|uniref:Phosphatase PAP2 family protein n=1 Tax=Solicola gregarius TaxID=2908642 RepID=A0AA46TLP1_9ACTN|nr:phosphatase PAP2 family protein [Solicola gregarius]UYM07370.1 phosphatase PAP2 family protein [Solicola gregarius]